MSLHHTSTPSKNGPRHLFKLAHAADHSQWKSMLQDYMFASFKNVNMDQLTSCSTLDPEYYKAHNEFKAEFKAASRDGDSTPCDPFDNKPQFALNCFEHALSTGEGFKKWVYTTYADIRKALSNTIQKQTSGVRRGDIVSLLNAIKLAVNECEIFNPDDLDISFTKCTMQGEGNNNLMTYLAALSNYIRRLEAVNLPPEEGRKMRVLLNGLDQDVFENFISAADRAPYKDYAALQFAVQSLAAKPRIAGQLKALKPGQAASMHVTLLETKSPRTQRFEKLEQMMNAFVQNQRGGDKK